MKALFLDIDGVLRTDSENAQHEFNGRCVEALNKILKETGCEIVLTSDRRLYMTNSEIDFIFKDNDIIKTPLFKTGYFKATIQDLEEKRGDEINEFLDQNKEEITKWCAVDDMDLSPFVKNFVKTKFNVGLQEPEVVNKIINFLK